MRRLFTLIKTISLKKIVVLCLLIIAGLICAVVYEHQSVTELKATNKSLNSRLEDTESDISEQQDDIDDLNTKSEEQQDDIDNLKDKTNEED